MEMHDVIEANGDVCTKEMVEGLSVEEMASLAMITGNRAAAKRVIIAKQSAAASVSDLPRTDMTRYVGPDAN